MAKSKNPIHLFIKSIPRNTRYEHDPYFRTMVDTIFHSVIREKYNLQDWSEAIEKAKVNIEYQRSLDICFKLPITPEKHMGGHAS